MNADFNPRGGLTVDRASLHASPEYARQVEAAKQLQERKVNADVEKAVEYMLALVRFGNGVTKDHFGCIEQELRDQEAEIAGLRADLSDADERAAMRNRERTEAVMRAEKADALLRETLRYLDPRHYSEIIKRITAHLGGEHE